jgi:hypothetical protein
LRVEDFVLCELKPLKLRGESESEAMLVVQAESRHIHAGASVGALQGLLPEMVFADDGADNQGMADDRAER